MGNADIDVPGMPPTNPSLERLETIVRLCEQADRRADVKIARAEAEKLRASGALAAARADRDAWIANNPDPQLMMF
ncbi:hypothetical protein [Novosphingobium clariflavum]|uniref:Uncharacterized protein n=1 Tax=Novosphingobium clariflavum TaxID=2029884 RepID=A0ABV6S2T0_9SPHN|nr:hypothetical protein [Novosphingobium clariflavum]